MCRKCTVIEHQKAHALLQRQNLTHSFSLRQPSLCCQRKDRKALFRRDASVVGTRPQVTPATFRPALGKARHRLCTRQTHPSSTQPTYHWERTTHYLH